MASALARMLARDVLPVAGWETCASRIPAQKRGEYAIIKKPITRGSYLEMGGVFGYEQCVFLEDSVITVLMRGDTVVMSDTPMEYYSMWELCARVRGGRVLIGGLGLGILTSLVALRRDVEEVTVVEVAPEVIEMVKPYLPKTVEVIQGDVYVVFPRFSMRRVYDTVIMDIWEKYSEDGAEEARILLEMCFEDAQHLYWGRFQREVEEEQVIFFHLGEKLK